MLVLLQILKVLLKKYERWKLLISVQFVLVCYNDMIHMLDK